MAAHGYTNYTHGCRCEVCRAAKREYVRGRRRRAAVKRQRVLREAGTPNGIYIALLGRHGTRFGFEECGCRCPDCCRARALSSHRSYKTSLRSAS